VVLGIRYWILDARYWILDAGYPFLFFALLFFQEITDNKCKASPQEDHGKI